MMTVQKIKTKNKIKAFTLVELLFVMAIMGVLAAIILVNLDAGRQRSIMSKNISQLDQIVTALEAYKTQIGTYPPGSWQGYCSAYGPSLGANWIPELVTSGLVTSALPVDTRQEGNPGCVDSTKQYFYVSDGTDYKLISPNLNNVTGAPPDAIDPRRPTTAISRWSPGAAAW
jgi:prepilin-type N-terminal cleavage/methylation domain-containing protein